MTGATISRAVAEVLTRWAESFEGGCGHHDEQYSRPGALRSGCRTCTTAFDGWASPGPCDTCGQVTAPAGAWALPPTDTGNVLVLMRICTNCSVHDFEEDEMTDTCCPDCMRTFARAALRATRGHDFSGMHPSCREALAQGLRGYGPATKGDPDLNSRIRIVLATRALRGAA